MPRSNRVRSTLASAQTCSRRCFHRSWNCLPLLLVLLLLVLMLMPMRMLLLMLTLLLLLHY